MKSQFMGILVVLLVVSMPFYASSALADIRVDRNTGEDGIPNFIDGQGDTWNVDVLIRDVAEAVSPTDVKMKVGSNLKDDIRRAKTIRDEIGPEIKLMMDANQKWDVDEAIENIKELSKFDPWWIEEPTNPDDILGHAKIGKAINPIKVATGEHCHNRVMFKQLMQSNAIGICQIDSCRVGGVNEVLAILLMAAKYDVPVCPHAGGVGLCEYVQHLSMIDYISISGKNENRVTEYVAHLHEHFKEPVIIKNAAYMPPKKPGYSITMKESSIKDYSFPDGREWLKKRPSL